MALRGMLTQNIDRKEAEDYSANTDERKEPVQLLIQMKGRNLFRKHIPIRSCLLRMNKSSVRDAGRC